MLQTDDENPFARSSAWLKRPQNSFRIGALPLDGEASLLVAPPRVITRPPLEAPSASPGADFFRTRSLGGVYSGPLGSVSRPSPPLADGADALVIPKFRPLEDVDIEAFAQTRTFAPEPEPRAPIAPPVEPPITLSSPRQKQRPAKAPRKPVPLVAIAVIGAVSLAAVAAFLATREPEPILMTAPPTASLEIATAPPPPPMPASTPALPAAPPEPAGELRPSLAAAPPHASGPSAKSLFRDASAARRATSRLNELSQRSITVVPASAVEPWAAEASPAPQTPPPSVPDPDAP